MLGSGYMPTNLQAVKPEYLGSFYDQHPDWTTSVGQWPIAKPWFGYPGNSGPRIWDEQKVVAVADHARRSLAGAGPRLAGGTHRPAGPGEGLTGTTPVRADPFPRGPFRAPWQRASMTKIIHLSDLHVCRRASAWSASIPPPGCRR